MASKNLERRLEQLENLALFGGGVAAGTASGRQLLKSGAKRGLSLAPRLAATGGRMAMVGARAHPVGAAVTLAYLGYIHREQIMDVAQTLAETASDVGGVMREALDAEVARSGQMPLIGGPSISGPTSPLGGAMFDLLGYDPATGKKKKRKKNQFSADVKKGMLFVKKSNLFGKRGKITNSKGAFSAVAKAAAALRKNRARPKSKVIAKISRFLRRKGN